MATHVVEVVGVERHDGGDDLDLVAQALDERRAQRPVDQAAGEDGVLGGTALTAEERAGDLARGVHPLLDVHRQREEVEVLLGVLATRWSRTGPSCRRRGRRRRSRRPAGPAGRSRTGSVRVPNEPLSMTASADGVGHPPRGTSLVSRSRAPSRGARRRCRRRSSIEAPGLSLPEATTEDRPAGVAGRWCRADAGALSGSIFSCARRRRGAVRLRRNDGGSGAMRAAPLAAIGAGRAAR